MVNPGDFIEGFRLVATGGPIVAALVGALVGTALGVLPGLSPTVVLSLLLVPTTDMDPASGLTMLAAAYFGTQYGDTLSAVLLRVPSEPVAIVLTEDGYALTRRGRSGAVLSMAAMASFIGAMIGLVGLVLCSALVSHVVFSLGPVEVTAIAILGILLLSRIAVARLPLALIAIGIGLMLYCVGIDPQTGHPRLTLGSTLLDQGFSLVPIILGLVGLADVMVQIGRGVPLPSPPVRTRFMELRPNRDEATRSAKAATRGGLLGFVLGLIPGPGLTIASFVSYRLERSISRRQQEFGHGAIEGVTGPKAADDAAVSASLASLLTLGIPFTPATAVLYSGFLLHGITPGPLLLRQDPALFAELVAAMVIANVVLLILNAPLVGIWVWLLKIPTPVLTSCIVCFVLVGSFSLRNNAFDMLVTLGAGILGYVLQRVGVPRAVVVVSLILGPVLETDFRESMELGGGSLGVFVDRPVSAVILVLAVLALATPHLGRAVRLATPRRPRVHPPPPTKDRTHDRPQASDPLGSGNVTVPTPVSPERGSRSADGPSRTGP